MNFTKEDYVIAPMALCNVDAVMNIYISYRYHLIDRLTRRDLLPPFVITNDENMDKEDEAYQFFVKQVNCINLFVSHVNVVLRFDREEETRKFAQKVVNDKFYIENTVKILNLFSYYLGGIPDLTDSDESELMDYLRFTMFIPVIHQQAKRQKIATGVLSGTNKILYSPIKAVYPTDRLIRRSSLRDISPYKLPQHQLNHYSSNYFIFAVSWLYHFLDENLQYLIPKTWIAPVFCEFLDVPDIGGTWEQYVSQAIQNKRYALFEQGVIVNCSKMGDIESILIKELQIESEVHDVCYAKVTFKGGYEDVVMFNPSNKNIMCSGFGDIYHGNEDLVLKIVAKAYMNLVSTKEIVHSEHNSSHASISTSSSVRSSSTSTFHFVPRVEYQSGTSNSYVRRKLDITKKPHPVTGHLRKGKPSQQALEKAKKYGIQVPEGYTFVEGYFTGKKKGEMPRYNMRNK